MNGTTTVPHLPSLALDTVRLARVSPSLNMSALKAECIARGISSDRIKANSKTKNDLLLLLVDGTILLSETREFKVVEQLKAAIEVECAQKKSAALELDAIRRAEAERQKQKRAATAEAKKEAERNAARAAEIERQKQYHVVPIDATVHSCALLAPTQSLVFHGFSRERSAQCDASWAGCTRSNVVLSCDSCGFDLCRNCAELAKLDAAGRDKKRKERELEVERARKLAKQEEERRQRMYEAEKRAKQKEVEKLIKDLEKAKDSIKKPSGVNKDKNKMLKYVVWKSDGYDNDGWHSYDGPPEKEFDSSYASKVDANARVKYLFYTKNVWGLGVDEMLERDEIIETENDALLHLETCPADSSRWTVAAVPREAFKFLDNAKNSRGYSSDDDERGMAYYGSAW
ncbi:hypothetical protein HDU79_004851 [Rhizoclosmatium sp. JEL0117]|nr:hypothetical protein HDU79_004851 [Rhizoclosmatium sp. JEL0117]